MYLTRRTKLLCDKCWQQGLKSKVYVGGSSATCMSGSTYYDEEGFFHRHDPNWSTAIYRCDNGHRWQVKVRQGCENWQHCGVKPQEQVTWLDDEQEAVG